MLIGEVTKRAGLSKDTIRHYEALGLLHSSPRRAGTREYRDYDNTTLERLSLIAFAKRLQIPLRTMVDPINRALSNSSTATERTAFIRKCIEDVEERIVKLQMIRDELSELAENPVKPHADARMKALGIWIE